MTGVFPDHPAPVIRNTDTGIDILISQAVSPGNLRLEEASLAELNELRRSLELGIEQVKAALRRTGVEV